MEEEVVSMASSQQPWKEVIEREWKRRRGEDLREETLFPLATSPFGEEEIVAMTDVVLSGKLTLGMHVERAEKKMQKRSELLLRSW